MIDIDFVICYCVYIDCLNWQDWLLFGEYVFDDVIYNDWLFGFVGYCVMLEQDFCDIFDFCFDIWLFVCELLYVVCCFCFVCVLKGMFMGFVVDGCKVMFVENVFYEFYEGKICQVWLVIDKVVIEQQLQCG